MKIVVFATTVTMRGVVLRNAQSCTNLATAELLCCFVFNISTVIIISSDTSSLCLQYVTAGLLFHSGSQLGFTRFECVIMHFILFRFSFQCGNEGKVEMNMKEMANDRTLYQGQAPLEWEGMIQHLDYVR